MDCLIDHNAPKEVAMTSLDWCARSRQLTLLNAILAAHFSNSAISDLERECNVVLRNAVTSGCKETVTSLLRHVSDAFLRQRIEGGVREGRTRLDKLLGMAVEHGHRIDLRTYFIMDSIVDHNAPKEVAMTSLDWCARSRQLTLLNAILAAHFSNSAISDLERECNVVLRNAVTSGCKETVTSLLRHVSDAFLRQRIEGGVREGRTRLDKLLGMAVEHGHSDVAETLLQKGADASCWYRNKPLLHLALTLGYAHLATLLVQSGADVNMTDSKGETPIFSAVSSESIQKDPIIDLLITKGANVIHQSVTGRQPIHCAALASNAHAVSRLAEAGCDVNARDCVLGDTPLHLACARCSKEAVLELLRRGARMNEVNGKGHTPLRKLLQHVSHGASKDFHQNSRLKFSRVLVTIGLRLQPSAPASYYDVDAFVMNGDDRSNDAAMKDSDPGNSVAMEDRSYLSDAKGKTKERSVAKFHDLGPLSGDAFNAKHGFKSIACWVSSSNFQQSNETSTNLNTKMSKPSTGLLTSSSWPSSSAVTSRKEFGASKLAVRKSAVSHSSCTKSRLEKSPFDLLIDSLESSKNEEIALGDGKQPENEGDDCCCSVQEEDWVLDGESKEVKVNKISSVLRKTSVRNDETVSKLSPESKQPTLRRLRSDIPSSSNTSASCFLRLRESLKTACDKGENNTEGPKSEEELRPMNPLESTPQGDEHFTQPDDVVRIKNSQHVLQYASTPRKLNEHEQNRKSHQEPKAKQAIDSEIISGEGPKTKQPTNAALFSSSPKPKRAPKRDKVGELMTTLMREERKGRVASLQHLCRLEVRSCLPGIRFQERVNAELELSPQMRQYLMFLPTLIDDTM